MVYSSKRFLKIPDWVFVQMMGPRVQNSCTDTQMIGIQLCHWKSFEADLAESILLQSSSPANKSFRIFQKRYVHKRWYVLHKCVPRMHDHHLTKISSWSRMTRTRATCYTAPPDIICKNGTMHDASTIRSIMSSRNGPKLTVLPIFRREVGFGLDRRPTAVSYTHLTLPTIYSV